MKKARILNIQVIILLALLLLFVSLLPECASMGNLQLPVQAVPGYRLSLFASGNRSYQNPDGVAVDQGHVFLDYANITEKDGSDGKTSTVVEYDMNGQVLQTFSVSGHSDGLRIDPATHKVWALSNEDQNPVLTIIDPNRKKPPEVYTLYAPHGGGYDDLYFLDNSSHPFLSASNPILNNGKNDNPLVYQVTRLVPGESGQPGHVDLFPILAGHASATDVFTNTPVILDETDVDSLSTDSQGNLVLISQESCDVIVLVHPGTLQQEVRRLHVGTQVDDTVWIHSSHGRSVHGRLLIVDAARNQTYWMETTFERDTIYTETYQDSSVQSVVGQLNPKTGVLTIVATGFLKPTGLLFVPD